MRRDERETEEEKRRNEFSSTPHLFFEPVQHYYQLLGFISRAPIPNKVIFIGYRFYSSEFNMYHFAPGGNKLGVEVKGLTESSKDILAGTTLERWPPQASWHSSEELYGDARGGWILSQVLEDVEA